MSTPNPITNKAGPWVHGDDFWDRVEEVRRLQELLHEGNNVLLVAMRRIGKTSLVRETFDHMTKGGYYALFVDVQGCTRPEDVIVEISKATRIHKPLWDRTLDIFKSFLSSLGQSIDSVALDLIHLKFKEGVAEAWAVRGDRLLESLATAERPILLCLDELPVMLTRLLSSGPGGRETTAVFLSWLRKVCGEHQGRIRFVICGSIGLEPIVAHAGLSHTIAHLRPFHIGPWTREVAGGCLDALAEHYAVQLPPAAKDEMLRLLAICVPHHVQMFFGHMLDDCRRRQANAVSAEDVRRVYESAMLGPRGHAELADYEERLRRVLGPEATPLALDFLTEAAVAGKLTHDSISVIAERSAPATTDRPALTCGVLDVLVHDGYLLRSMSAPGSAPALAQTAAETDAFEFVGGLLRDWWRRRFGTGHVPAQRKKA
ncbi:MAG: ATP-binding protein [Planctomycetes bacterium]|nr:ATP-binding protein [Planctomycetota bacterium]